VSSFVGHASVGVALYASRHALRARPVWWALPVMVFLAMSPDIDYLGLWLLSIVPRPRITHSLLFCLGVATFAWAAVVLRGDSARRVLPWWLLAAAACSHLVLDMLVGVHPVPLLWPLQWPGSQGELVLPFGLLPSAGHLRWSNHVLWRNLFIECGVLWPLLAAGVAWARGVSFTRARWWVLGIAPCWLGCLVWSVQLQR